MGFEGHLTLIDFEATSKYSDSARAIEIALIALDENLNEVSRYSSVIRPPVNVPKDIMLYTRLSPDEISEAPIFEEIWPDLHPYLSGRVLVAQNAKYDLGVLANELADLEIYSSQSSICTYEMAKRNLSGVTRDLKLGTMCEYFGIPLDAHKALDDAYAAGEVLRKFLEMNPGEYSEIGRAVDLATSLPEPDYSAKPAFERQSELFEEFRSTVVNVKNSSEVVRRLSDLAIEDLAKKIIASGRTQVCLTGEPSNGKKAFSNELEQVGFEYTVGPIRKTKTAFFVIGVKEVGNDKKVDADKFQIPTFEDSDYRYLITVLQKIKGVEPQRKSTPTRKYTTKDDLLKLKEGISTLEGKKSKKVEVAEESFTSAPRLADNDGDDPQALSIPLDLEVTPEMQEVIDLVQAGRSVFLTGNAGTGKSTILAYLRKYVLDENTAVCAPTGVAAINVRGVTIHNFFGFGIDVTFEHVKGPDYHPKNQDAMRVLRTLVIDEISMVRADMLDYVDIALRRFGPNKNKPFGGVQVILIGDLAQIAPIVGNPDERDFISSHYLSEFFFDSYALQNLDIKTVTLNKIYRQTDLEFINTLNAVRLNQMDEGHYEFLDNLVDPNFQPGEDDFFITLTTTNKRANDINVARLEALPSKLYRNRAWVNGKFREKDFPTLQNLQFKVGSQIMLVNNDPGGRWANGTLARITEINISSNRADSHIKVVVMGGDGTEHEVTPHRWDMLSAGFDGARLTYEPAGTFSQYPFTLAWAITIHKSQGKTFDQVILDLTGNAFAPGQLYVALSRCRGSEGLVLHNPVTPDQVITHPRVIEYLGSPN